jgi:hypothetical protein
MAEFFGAPIRTLFLIFTNLPPEKKGPASRAEAGLLAG